MNRTLALLAMVSALASPRAYAEKAPDGICLLPDDRIHNTDWFHDAGWGLFVHYLWDVQNAGARVNRMGKTTSWDECVKEFDTEKFAEQIQQTGAKYVYFTMMQRTRYLIAPNATYDKLTGYKPGEACSTRDLVEDLYQSLNKRGIKLMLYWTGDGPREDAQAAKGMGGYNGGVSDQYVSNWAAVAREYSLRYGDKVHGWWVDGCYIAIGYNEKRWGMLAKALRAGNPKSIVAFNSPTMVVANSRTLNDDYTTGENNSFGEVPDSRWRDGVQWHTLSFLGPNWGTPGVRYKADFLTDYVGSVNDAGGVITMDVCLYRDGSLDAAQLATVKEMAAGLKQRAAERELWKTRKPVPEGNLACWKPARLLTLDGQRTLPANGGGDKIHSAQRGVDGDAATTAQASGEWPWTYQVDLLSAMDISRVVITFGKGYATDYEVTVSADGQKWQTVAAKQNHDGSKAEHRFEPVNARYVRVRGLKPDGANQAGGQMSIAELEVYP